MQSLPSADVHAAAKHILRSCYHQRAAYVECKKLDANGETCTNEKLALLVCSVGKIEELKEKAATQLKEYADCLDAAKFKYNRCRDKQLALESEAPLL